REIPRLSNHARIHAAPSPKTSNRRAPLRTPNCSNRADTCNHRPSAVASANAYRNPATSTTAVYVHTSLRPVDGWALVLTSSGSTITKPSSTARGWSWSTGNAGRYPLGKGLFPLGLGFLRVVQWQVVIDEPWHSVGVDYGGPEQGQLGFRRFVQDRAGTLALRDNQLLALLMHDVDDRAPPQQTLVPSGLANVGATRSRGSIAHLITDRVPEILGDGQLVGCVPDGRRWYFDRAVLVVADPRPLHGDCAEDGFEGERSCPPALDASTGFAVPVLENQFLIGLLDQNLEEPALDFETGLMNVRLNLVGEMLVLPWH